jgi:predicted Zn-dependent protease
MRALAIALIGKLKSLGYSREAESAADVTGSDVCAESGYNPWGLVWLFQDFDAANLALRLEAASHLDSEVDRHSRLGALFRNG